MYVQWHKPSRGTGTSRQRAWGALCQQKEMSRADPNRSLPQKMGSVSSSKIAVCIPMHRARQGKIWATVRWVHPVAFPTSDGRRQKHDIITFVVRTRWWSRNRRAGGTLGKRSSKLGTTNQLIVLSGIRSNLCLCCSGQPRVGNIEVKHMTQNGNKNSLQHILRHRMAQQGQAFGIMQIAPCQFRKSNTLSSAGLAQRRWSASRS